MQPTTARFVSRLLALLMFAGCIRIASAQTAPALSPDRVTFFTEPNFKGEALTVEAGASVENLDRMQRANQQPWTFAISSVRVEGAARATVYTAPGFGGERLEISRSIPDLYSEPRPRDASTWDRSIASVAVTGPQRVVVQQPPPPAPREGPPPNVVVVQQPPPRREPPPPTVVIVPQPAPPPRPRLDRRTAELIVQRAFREVLNRPADPDGLRTYRDRLMYEGWSEQQVIQQLQRSGEARGVNADEAITKAYREVLGRDPDPNGLAHYRAKWRDGWTQGQIRDDLKRSTEGARSMVIRVYREVLGRDPDPSGLATYEKAVRERGWTERELRQTLMSGDEYRQKRVKR